PLTIMLLSASSPSVVATASATTGSAPLTVSFGATLSGLVPTAYLWDFDGDGVVDSASVTGAAASFTFRVPGTYTPRLIVRDRSGQATRASAPTIAVSSAAAPTLSTFSVGGGFIPYAATFSAGYSDLRASGTGALDL